MSYLSLKWRIQIVMCALCVGLVPVVVYWPDSLPVPMNQTTTGLLICGAFLISIIIGIVWHWHSLHTRD
jgi:uncharacterized membrane protein (DUF485 family)